MMNSLYPNIHHNQNWTAGFSNIPTVSKIDDIKYFDGYIRDLVIPGISNQAILSDHINSVIRHPSSHENDNMEDLVFTFACSEDMNNYLWLFEWSLKLKYGDFEEEVLRNRVIDNFTIRLLDNEKRDIARLSFSKLLITNLSSIPLRFGEETETTFTASFSYETINFTRVEL